MKHPAGSRGRLLEGAAGAYALALLAWHALRHTPVAGWWPFTLLDIFGRAFYAPFLALVLVAAPARALHALAWLAALLRLVVLGLLADIPAAAGTDSGWLLRPGAPAAFRWPVGSRDWMGAVARGTRA